MRNERELIDAIMSGDGNRLSTLLAASDNVEELLKSRISDAQPTNHAIGHGMTLLQLASYRLRKGGDAASVLLSHGAAVDLHSACGLGRTDRIGGILDADPNALAHSIDSYFPIQFAITASQPSAIECLIDHGDDPNRELTKVAYFGWEDDTRDQDYTRWKPIHMASLYAFNASRIPVAQALAKAGADLNAVSPLDGYQPIHLVAMANRVDMIRFLVSMGVDVDVRTAKCVVVETSDDCAGPTSGFELTPLMVAAAEGFPNAVACLLELGADPNAKSDQGQTATDYAKQRFWNGQPYDEVIDLLAT